MSEALPVIILVYKLYKQVVDINSKLPKTHRYGIGQSLENSVLELKVANETKIFQAQSTLRDIGRMAGGWLKSVSN